MIYEILKARRSVRRFQARIPERELIERMIEGAITAPSASNKQPWRFFVVTNKALIQSMAQTVRQAIDRIARHIEPSCESSFRDYGDYFTRFENAPVVIVPLCRSMTVLSNLCDASLSAEDRASIQLMEQQSGWIGTSMALQNLLLMAHDLGLGASGMTGPLVAANTIRELLNVPESWDIVALVPVGYPDEVPTPTQRKPVENVTRWIN